MGGLEFLLCVAAMPVVIASAYLALLAALSRRANVSTSYAATSPVRFDIIVPAHDEEAGIARTVENLQTLEYPRDQFRVIVIADNCTDRTAAIARQAGAIVWERASAQRGKGHALRFAYQRSADDGFADAVVVVDADSQVSKNLLRAFATRLSAGARAVQAEYGVLNVHASWRTQLMTLAFALFHGVRSTARERLRLSAGLRGNGMCFTHELLREHPHRAFSVVEDVEYAAQLSEAGVRVQFAADAHVLGEMPSGEKASRSQRRRWEGGRSDLLRRHVPSLLRRFVASRDIAALDTALDLLVPPLSRLCFAIAAGLVLSGAYSAWSGSVSTSLGLFSFCAAAIGLYVVQGYRFSGLGRAGASALVRAPAYLIWKLMLRFKRPEHARDEWVRTAREPNKGASL